MKITHFFLYSALLVFALACGQASTDTASDTTDVAADTPETTDTATEEAAYTITVLDADLPSPRKEMKGSIGGIDITVNYGSPSVRNRTVWGELEPFDQVWRTGANEATSIQFSGDVQIEGEALAAGRYSLFSIFDKNKNWTLILNSVADQWGAFEYDDTKDVLRVELSQDEKSNAEQLDFLIEGNTVVLRWEKIAVPFKVTAAE